MSNGGGQDSGRKGNVGMGSYGGQGDTSGKGGGQDSGRVGNVGMGSYGRSRKGGYGKSGAAHAFDGTSPGFGSSSGLSVDFNPDDVSLGGLLARAGLGLVSGGPLGAIGGALSGLAGGLSFS